MVEPSSELASPATVRVLASGFSGGEALVVSECADKGARTGPGDCDLATAAFVSSDATGHVETQLTVTKGPFGQNRIVCGRPFRCLVSVSQPVPHPSEEADAPIGFR